MLSIHVQFDRKTTSKEKIDIFNTIINLGWECAFTFSRSSSCEHVTDNIAGYTFSWKEDKEPVFPKDIEYTLSKG